METRVTAEMDSKQTWATRGRRVIRAVCGMGGSRVRTIPIRYVPRSHIPTGPCLDADPPTSVWTLPSRGWGGCVFPRPKDGEGPRTAEVTYASGGRYGRSDVARGIVTGEVCPPETVVKVQSFYMYFTKFTSKT